jgi:hypothetical protein
MKEKKDPYNDRSYQETRVDDIDTTGNPPSAKSSESKELSSDIDNSSISPGILVSTFQGIFLFICVIAIKHSYLYLNYL